MVDFRRTFVYIVYRRNYPTDVPRMPLGQYFRCQGLYTLRASSKPAPTVATHPQLATITPDVGIYVYPIIGCRGALCGRLENGEQMDHFLLSPLTVQMHQASERVSGPYRST